MTGSGGEAVASNTYRRLSSPLLLGIYVMPILFVWLVFRGGYSQGLRGSALAWLAFNLLLAAGAILAGF
jgi:hypothetical protein